MAGGHEWWLHASCKHPITPTYKPHIVTYSMASYLAVILYNLIEVQFGHNCMSNTGDNCMREGSMIPSIAGEIIPKCHESPLAEVTETICIKITSL